MPNGYVSLRERLKQTAPDLAADLDHQWKIAYAEWLPAIKMSHDSSNSLAHLRNIENHLDATLNSLYQQDKTAGIFQMRPIETYLLLAAILFHDIGRANSKAKDHGDESQKYLKEKYGSLGIRDREVANSLGRICAYHTKEPGLTSARYAQNNLSDIVIDPYGEVRQRMIAAFLRLCDSMDNAYTRAIPSYLRKKEDMGIKGRFRGIILGVMADPAARIVKTVLMPRPTTDKSQPSEKLYATADKEPFIGERDYWIERLLVREKDAVDGKLKRKLNKLWENNPKEIALKDLNKYKIKISLKNNNLSIFDTAEKLQAWNILCLKSKGSISLPWERLAATILGDLRKNRDVLYSIRDNLATVGLSLATWLIDCEERLYTPDWHETYEPLFNKDYLKDAANGMWNLSRRIIGTTEFSYAELASYIGEYNVAKVRTAVHRLSIIMSERKKAQRIPPSCPIWTGEDTWKWRAKARHGEKKCEFLTLEMVKARIDDEKFCDPYSTDEIAEVSNDK